MTSVAEQLRAVAAPVCDTKKLRPISHGGDTMPGFWFYDAGRHGLTDVLMPDYFARVTMHGVRRGDIIDFRFGNLDPVEASYARLVVDNLLPPGPVTVAVVGRVGKPVPARKYADE